MVFVGTKIRSFLREKLLIKKQKELVVYTSFSPCANIYYYYEYNSSSYNLYYMF